jgi:murein DD-endopeptidase MepM/ murein hydrolase activator NlpD
MVGRRQLYTLLQLIALVVLLITNGFILDFILNINNGQDKDISQDDQKECKSIIQQSVFGFDPNNYQLNVSKLNSGQSLSALLIQYVPKSVADKVIKNISSYVKMNQVKAGKTIGFAGANLCMHPDYFIYEINPSKYLISELRGDLCVNLFEKTKEYRREHAAGIIESSLWSSLQNQDISLDLIDQMEDALASAVDFHHVQKGNEFKLIFDRLYIDGQPTQASELIAAYFQTDYKESYSFSYEVNNKKGFYDLKGSPMVSKFLRAPLRFSRISSGFNMNRFHPVLKYSRPHLGTDYAAPTGTPIMSVGSGIVEAASYTGGNGNFVKIKHDKTYETQYLHMSRFANGIRRGATVSQGQVIGYVGSTGLASGPHVCFRFWKNGTQVNHLKLIFPSPDPLPTDRIQEYFKHRDEIVKLFDSIQFSTALNRTKNS